MSLTVSTVQVPHRYRHSQYETTRRIAYSSSQDHHDTYPRIHTQHSVNLQSPNISRPHRWSQSSESNESIEEEPQMSGHGSVPRPPLYDKKPEQMRSQGPNFSSENVLPPLVYPKQEPAIEGRSARSRDSSPTRRVATAMEHTDRRGPRLLGVHSILNPPQGEEGTDARRSRRCDAPELALETGAKFTPPLSIIAPTRPLSGDGGAHGETSPPGQAPRSVRRILTPISPRLHKATSYGRLPGTIDALERPFLSEISRRTTPEHTSNSILSHLPPSMPQVTQQLPFIAPSAIPGQPYNQHSRRPSVSIVGSTRPSPSPSFADSYSQSGVSGQASPAMRPHTGLPTGPTPPASLGLSPSPRLGPSAHVTSNNLDNEQGFHNPVVSSGQNYQLMTVDTTRGHMQLPVEVQAASRMADEKRKRNAGASARFRARRKEKEREAAGKISNLETDLLWAQEDSRFYRAERDYLVEVILRNVPQYEHLLRERPASPRAKRLSQGITRPSITSIDSPLSVGTSDPYESGEAERPATRRRVEAYPPSAPSNDQPSQHHYPPYSANPASASMPPHSPYPQINNHVSGPHPPLLARPTPAGPTLPKPEHVYERPWPPRTNGPL